MKRVELENGEYYIEEKNHKTYYDFQNRKHRVGGPSFSNSYGGEDWYLHGKRHRVGGPAAEYESGIKEWWYNGQKIDCKTNEEFLRLIKMKAFL